MKNRNNKYKVCFLSGILILGLTLTSCEKYLDKAPEAAIPETEVFGNFQNFQGFIEECYANVWDWTKSGRQLSKWAYQFNFTDESLNTRGTLPFDQGDYWMQSILMGNGTTYTTSTKTMIYWPNCWHAIKKANLALAKLDLMTDATQEEKDLIEGQALFFRGFFHFEVMKFWGGMPYIDKNLLPSDNILLPRLSYRAASLKAAADLRAAADLLPVDWDQTTVGKATLGNNRQRASKVMALSFLGKVLLYAASPMMNEESTGNTGYDAELCKQAAAAFAEAISICNSTGMFKLEPWETWTDNFWVDSPNYNKRSGGTEAIMMAIPKDVEQIRWGSLQCWVLYGLGVYAQYLEAPTHNWVKNYYMANGLPIDDPLSGYNPNDPWTNREPRFYNDITIDGDELVYSSLAGTQKYAQLYNGGLHRGGTNGSPTGYAFKRWVPKGCNTWDAKWNSIQYFIPHMRLADVYLMYAEAVLHGYGTPQSSVPGSLTAEDAVNVIRDRAQLPDLTATYTATKETFMEDLMQERAVELAWDANRFHDLRRWNLNGDPRYLNKTAIDFDRGTDGKPINIVERVVITRTVEKKHNWLPLPVKQTTIYPGFYQNPGW